MNNLDSPTCAMMASVTTNSWHFPKSKMAACLVYFYCSPCQFESFSWSILEGSIRFLRGPCSLYRSRRGHHEVNSKRVFTKDQLRYCKPQSTCYFFQQDIQSTLTQTIILIRTLCNTVTIKLYNKEIYVRF